MGEEIRRRLEASFEAEAETPTDPKTSELLDQIRDIARDLSRREEWHSSRFVFEVFKAAVNALLARYQPSNETKAETIARLKGVWGDKEPEEMGRFIAGAANYAYSHERLRQAFLEAVLDTAVSPKEPAAPGRVRAGDLAAEKSKAQKK